MTCPIRREVETFREAADRLDGFAAADDGTARYALRSAASTYRNCAAAVERALAEVESDRRWEEGCDDLRAVAGGVS